MKIVREREKWMELALDRVRLSAIREIASEQGRWVSLIQERTDWWNVVRTDLVLAALLPPESYSKMEFRKMVCEN